MIANIEELNATLEYVAKLADSLEGLRRHAQETGETALLPLSAAGPLTHLRENLAEVRAYTERLAMPDTTVFATAASASFGVSKSSAKSERVGELTPR